MEIPPRSQGASDGITAPELDRLSAALFVGPLAHWAGSLAFHDHPEAVATRGLTDRALLDGIIDRFGRNYPGAGRRAVASFWSQNYFARLTIVLTTFCLAAARPLSLDFGSLRVRFCPGTGTPLCFHLCSAGPARPTGELVRALYDEQVAGMVADLKRYGGLSTRLLWENAGCYGMWILGEIARTQPALAPAAEALLSDPHWPRTGCAMLPHMKCAAREGRSAVRRVCCLRYRLPGVERCAGTCPLRDGEDTSVPAAG